MNPKRNVYIAAITILSVTLGSTVIYLTLFRNKDSGEGDLLGKKDNPVSAAIGTAGNIAGNIAADASKKSDEMKAVLSSKLESATEKVSQGKETVGIGGTSENTGGEEKNTSETPQSSGNRLFGFFRKTGSFVSKVFSSENDDAVEFYGEHPSEDLFRML